MGQQINGQARQNEPEGPVCRADAGPTRRVAEVDLQSSPPSGNGGADDDLTKDNRKTLRQRVGRPTTAK